MGIQNNQLTQPFTDSDKSKLDTVQTGAEPNPPTASQAEAEAGLDNTKLMTALRVNQAIQASGGGGGSVTGASNTGTGVEVFKDLVSKTLRFRKLKAGSGVTLTQNADDLTISASPGGLTNTDGLPEGSTNKYFTDARVSTSPSVVNAAASATGSITAHSDIQVSSPTTGQALVWNGTKWANAAVSGSGEVNTASNLGSGSQLYKSKVGVDLQFRSLVAGSGVTLTQNANDVTINATASSGHITQYLTFDSGNIIVLASGTSADLSAVTATKDFSTTGQSTVILNRPSSVTYRSVAVTFTAGETTGRVAGEMQVPDPNGATTLDKAIRPLGFRLSSVGGAPNLSSTTSLIGSTVSVICTGATAGVVQKYVFSF